MAFTVTSSNSYTNMTTLFTVKAMLGVSNSDDDALLELLIRQATSMVETETDRKFAKETVEETLPSNGSNYLIVSRTPVVSITSIELDGSTVDSSDYSLEDSDAGLIFNEDGWVNTIIMSNYLTGYSTQTGAKDYKITYEGGYVMPGDGSEERTFPWDLEFAAVDIVRMNYRARKMDPRVRSVSVGDASSLFADSNIAIPPNAWNTIQKYKRLEPTIW